MPKCKNGLDVALKGIPTKARSPRFYPLWRDSAKPASRVGDPNAMQATSDEVLIGRLANGDRSAMHVLYARHHVRVFRFVLRLVRDKSMAEDVISEVFLDVWLQADRFEGRSQVLTWVLGIARLKAFSALRQRPEGKLDEQTALAIEDPADDPATTLENKDT